MNEWFESMGVDVGVGFSGGWGEVGFFVFEGVGVGRCGVVVTGDNIKGMGVEVGVCVGGSMGFGRRRGKCWGQVTSA